MKRIERIIVDECVGRASALLGQLCCRLGGDRKSTRLNSSHTVISYAVFCLQKKQTIGSHHARFRRWDPESHAIEPSCADQPSTGKQQHCGARSSSALPPGKSVHMAIACAEN